MKQTINVGIEVFKSWMKELKDFEDGENSDAPMHVLKDMDAMFSEQTKEDA